MWIHRLARGLYYQKGGTGKSKIERSGVQDQEEDSDIDMNPYDEYEVFYKNLVDRIKKQRKEKEDKEDKPEKSDNERSESSISEIDESEVEHITQRSVNDPRGVTDIQ